MFTMISKPVSRETLAEALKVVDKQTVINKQRFSTSIHTYTNTYVHMYVC